MKDIRVKRYQSKYDYSYTLGMAPTMELLYNQRASVYRVYIDPRYSPGEGSINLIDYCEQEGIPYEVSDRVIERISNKGNVFVVGVFYKYEQSLEREKPHILLVNPSDAGNLGTILRTGLGFGFENIGVIDPGADHFHPNTIRASMGAVFISRVQRFASLDQYRESYAKQELYPFMLEGKYSIKDVPLPTEKSFTLIFGNEATGLPKEYSSYEKSVFISHSDKIDSLNLSIATGIAMHHFSPEV